MRRLVNLLARYKDRVIEAGEPEEVINIVTRVQCWAHEDLKRAKQNDPNNTTQELPK